MMIDGAMGPIHLIIDEPTVFLKGVAIISHPQPLLGGSPLHPIPVNVARKLCAEGWLAVRPSFRGVGKTAGVHDEGHGESQDSVAVVEYIKRCYPGIPIALVGFSFGAHVFARVACQLEGTFHAVVLLGLPVGDVPGGRWYEQLPLPRDTLLIHAEEDEMAPLVNLMSWARPQSRPVLVYPGSNHFFKGCLTDAVEQVARHLNRSSRD